MIVAIMQPYFFPYIGYFQLMTGSDVFVLHDDVQFVKNGWIQRNRILVNGRARWLSKPVAAGAHELPINRRKYLDDDEIDRGLLRKVAGAYASAPYLSSTMTLLEDAMNCGQSNVGTFNATLLKVLANALGIGARIELSSSLPKNDELHGQDRVINICKTLSADKYINSIGGISLYDPSTFLNNGLELEFFEPTIEPYAQFCDAFVPSLSIIDVLMFNGLPQTSKMIVVS